MYDPEDDELFEDGWPSGHDVCHFVVRWRGCGLVCCQINS